MEIRLVTTATDASLAHQALQGIIKEHQYSSKISVEDYTQEVLQHPDEAVILIALENEILAGAVTVGRGFCPYLPGFYGHVWGLYVSPEMRRQGVAEQLFAAARQEVRARGWKGMYWWVDAKNEKSQAFFAAKEIGELGTPGLDYWLGRDEI